MRKTLSIALACSLVACGQNSSEPQSVNEEPKPSLTSDKTSSSIRTAYFGDLHAHTGNSFDAFIFNVKATPDHAYRFAKGETIKHPGGFDISLGGLPLDFYAVTDHGEYLGVLRAMKDETNPLSKSSLAQDMSFSTPAKLQMAFGKISTSTRSGVRLSEIYDQVFMNSVWSDTVASANAHYAPGTFTTFAGYEFSSVRSRHQKNQAVGGNLHRNVIFRNQAPDQLFTTLDSPNPENLWVWMDDLRAQEIDSLAIPHNSNVSDGHMFSLKTYEGDALDMTYAKTRMRNEPLVELTQIKGTSEVHPSQAPNDEWADFEIYENLLNTTKKGQIKGSYIREALSEGLKLESSQGFNPFRFGFIGSSDTHVAGSGFTEQSHWGKMGVVDGRPQQRGSVPPKGAKNWEGLKPGDVRESPFGKWSASGLAGVWAEENTRESLFEAMRRKETFATSGPRMSVRLFAGYDFDEDVLSDPDMIKTAYRTGVSMGGTLDGSKDAPTFITWAAKDPRSAPLDRLQVIKLWRVDGVSKQKVFDVVCSKGVPDKETYRCPDNGARVDIKTCDISSGIGATELKVVWQDPTFNPGEYATYYLRALENPTCRWSTWDAVKAGVEPNPAFTQTVQERAWSSPIWYNPG